MMMPPPQGYVNHLGYPVMPPMPPMPPPGHAYPAGYAAAPGPWMGYQMPPGYAMPPAAWPMPPLHPPLVPGTTAAPVPVAVVMAEELPVAQVAGGAAVHAARATPRPAPAPVPAPRSEPAVKRVDAPACGMSEHESPALEALRRTALEGGTARGPGRLVRLWRSAGGGSLAFSLLVHGLILLAAGLVVVTTHALSDKAVDFLPGGGAQASTALSHQVQQKRRQRLQKSMPHQRLVSASTTAALSLPELPLGTLDVPDAGALPGGSLKLGSAGLGTGGLGTGFGSGLGAGAVKGFAGMTLFGRLGADGMPGVFYDMKQSPARVPTALADLASEADFAGVINTAAGKKFSGKGLDQFFHSTQKMSFTYLLIPYMAATEGPKAFKVDKEVQPRAWMVHYAADVRPPAPGEYRFVGLFDDALIVYVNGKPVLDGSWYSIVDHGAKSRTEGIREDFGGPAVPGTGNRRCYAGRWVRMDGLTHIDIVVGERPGGRVGGLLLVQQKKGRYEERADGTPILPVFATTKPDLQDEARLREYTASGFAVAAQPAVFTLTKDIFSTR